MKTLFRIKAINRNQHGFTLIELIIAIAITGLISSAAATGVYQVVKINATSTNRQIAISQVQNAINSISRDVEQAQQIIPLTTQNITSGAIAAASNKISFNLTIPSPADSNSLKLRWVDWNNAIHVILYIVDSNQNLTRKVYDDNNGLISQSQVASNITTPTNTSNWNISTKTLTLQIQAIVGKSNTVTETRTFQINPRSAQ